MKDKIDREIVKMISRDCDQDEMLEVLMSLISNGD